MLLTVGITASAQEALDSRHTIVSPEIHDDNRVTFRLKTPDHVASVRVGSDCFSSGGADLKKNAEGIWEYTTPEPLPSELYSYFYVVDGMMMLDPSNVYIVRDVSTTMNIFIIGGGIGDLYKVNAVFFYFCLTRPALFPTLFGAFVSPDVYVLRGEEPGYLGKDILQKLHGLVFSGA